MDKNITKRKNRRRRHHYIRSKVEGTEERPRLAVYRSNKHIYCQIINDYEGHTLCQASTLTPSIREEIAKEKKNAKDDEGFTKSDAAALVGKYIAEKAKEAGIEKVAFDRGGFNYHGRVKALAEAAREGGLDF